jgi:hypothetical protein
MDSPSTTTDSLCRDCAHMRPEADGGRWCFSPQLMKAQGRGSRCVFEVDTFLEKERSREKGTEKCGPEAKNFKRRETI